MAGLTLLEGLMNEAVLEHGKCIVGLSGGSTPKPLYGALGKSEEVDWSKIFVFLVDERHVEEADDDSNTKLIKDTLQPENFVYPTYAPLKEWQKGYDEELKKLFDGHWPDVVLLGMGEDGHIASLFPPVADDASDGTLTMHTTTDHFAVHDRLSTTLLVLTNAKSKIFLLKGEGKKNTWEAMEISEEGSERWPAKAVLESEGVTLVSQW